MRQNVFFLLVVVLIGCSNTLAQADQIIGMTTGGLARKPVDSMNTNRGLQSRTLASNNTDMTFDAEDEERWPKIQGLNALKNMFRKNPTTATSALREDTKIVETLQKNPVVMKKVESALENPVVLKNLERLQSDQEIMRSLQNGAPKQSVKKASSFLSKGMSEESAHSLAAGIFLLSCLVAFGGVIAIGSIVS